MSEAKFKRRDYQWFPKGFWASPSKAEARKGDRRKERIYMTVGHALSTWEQVEQSLVELYHVFCRTLSASMETKMAVARTYGSIESSTGRLKAMEAAAEAYFGHQWSQQDIFWPFDELVKSVRAASYIRNEIAHGIIISPWLERPNENGPPIVETFGSFLIAPSYITGRNDLFRELNLAKVPNFITSKYVYVSSDIANFTSKFGRLEIAISSYYMEINEEAKMTPAILSK